MRRSADVVLIVTAALASGVAGVNFRLRAQAPPVPPIVERMHVYSDASEPLLSALVADEVFDQRL